MTPVDPTLQLTPEKDKQPFPFQAVQRATSPELQTLILGNLTEPALLKMMEGKAQAHSLDWLRTIADCGLLDISPEAKTNAGAGAGVYGGFDNLQQSQACRVWSDRASALTTIMTRIRIDPADGIPTPANVIPNFPLGKAVFDFLPGTQEVFALAAQRIAASFSELRTQIDPAIFIQSKAQLAMGRWMAAACVMDQPASLELLYLACPGALEESFPLTELGEYMVRIRTKKAIRPENIQVTPHFVALQMSRLECLNFMADRAGCSQTPMGRIEITGVPFPCTFNLTTMHNYIAPVCDHQVYAHALRQLVAGPFALAQKALKEELLPAGLQAMDPMKAWMRPFVPSFIAAGAYEIDPAAAVKCAVENGFSQVVDHFKGRMPWADIKSMFLDPSEPQENPIYGGLLVGQTHRLQPACHQSILALLDQAGDAKEDFVLTTFISHPPTGEAVVEPLNSLVEQGLSSALMRYLDHGFDPLSRIDSETPTFLEQAEKISPEVGTMIRARLAREEAMEAIRELSAAPPRAVPAPLKNDRS